MILLSRAQYLHLSGTELQAYKSLRRRDQVPYFARGVVPLSKVSEEEEAAKGYLPIEAVMLALSNDLCAFGGLDRSLSARIVQGYPNLLIPAIRRAEAGEDVWFAHIVWREEKSQAEGLDTCDVGTVPEILKFIDDLKFDDDGYRPRADVYRITLTSVLRAVNQVRSRAEASGLHLGPILWEVAKD